VGKKKKKGTVFCEEMEKKKEKNIFPGEKKHIKGFGDVEPGGKRGIMVWRRKPIEGGKKSCYLKG